MTQAHERSATLSDLVAEEIRALLARRRMSGRQLAAQLGVSPSWVSYRLTGTQEIGVNDMQQIADALDVSVLQLIPANPSVSDDLNPRLSRPGRKDDPKPVRHVAPRRFGQPRRDPNGPPSATPLSSRRPRDTRPVKRPMAVAS
jgi:transcriptional regulator with XRE-family HTH domain